MSFNIHNYSNGNFEAELEQAMIASLQKQVKPSSSIKSSSKKMLVAANRVLKKDDNFDADLDQAIRASLKDKVKSTSSTTQHVKRVSQEVFPSSSQCQNKNPVPLTPAASCRVLSNPEGLAPIGPDGAALFT